MSNVAIDQRRELIKNNVYIPGRGSVPKDSPEARGITLVREANHKADALLTKAVRAFRTRQEKEDVIPQEPGNATSYVRKHNRATYIVLANVNGTLAVYRATDKGGLSFVKADAWPDFAREE